MMLLKTLCLILFCELLCCAAQKACKSDADCDGLALCHNGQCVAAIPTHEPKLCDNSTQCDTTKSERCLFGLCMIPYVLDPFIVPPTTPSPQVNVTIPTPPPGPRPEGNASVPSPPPGPRPEGNVTIPTPPPGPRPDGNATVPSPPPGPRPEGNVTIPTPPPGPRPEGNASVPSPPPGPRPEANVTVPTPPPGPRPEGNASVPSPPGGNAGGNVSPNPTPAPTPSPPPSPPASSTCRSHTDCPDAQLCEEMKCVDAEPTDKTCSDRQPCAATEVCRRGLCWKKYTAVTEVQCENHWNCPGNELCVDRSCKMSVPAHDCTQDRDCQQGAFCKNSKCWKVGCTKHDDCEGATLCNAKQECQQAKRFGGRCLVDANCGPNSGCKLGFCWTFT